MNQNNLKRYVQKTLLLRFIIAGIVIALLVAAISYTLERDRFTRSLAKRVADNAALITATRNQIGSLSNEQRTAQLNQTMKQIIDGLGEQRLQGDHFILLRFFDQDKKLQASSQEQGESPYRQLLETVEPLPPSFPKPDEDWFQVVRFDGQLVVHVVTYLMNFEGMEHSWFEGFYVLSDTTRAALRGRLLRAVLIAFSIVLLTIATVYPLVMSLADKLSRLSHSLMQANMETLQVLGSAIAKRDSDTNAHNYRVTIIAVRLAEVVGLSRRDIRGLIKGAFLHDVGKIGIRDDILLKPGKLDEDEYRVMKTHVDHGIEIVARSRWLSDALEVVHGHHEQITGKGYPDALAGDDIPIGARIFAIVDVFDALTSRRPYKEPFSFEKTMMILEQDSGTHFDATLIEAFKTIAEDIYTHIAPMEEGLEEELDKILKKYFAGGKEDLDDLHLI